MGEIRQHVTVLVTDVKCRHFYGDKNRQPRDRPLNLSSSQYTTSPTMIAAMTAIVTVRGSMAGDRHIMPAAHSTANTVAVRMRLECGVMTMPPADGWRP
jgi:hypothetical protein